MPVQNSTTRRRATISDSDLAYAKAAKPHIADAIEAREALWLQVEESLAFMRFYEAGHSHADAMALAKNEMLLKRKG